MPEADKRRRNNLLLAVQNEISDEDNAAFIGREVDVFVEGPSKREMKQERGTPSAGEIASDGSDIQPSTLHSQLVGRTRCDRLVVSLGVDAAADDPESPLQVTGAGYREAGRLLGATGVPAVAVQEGGYHLSTLGGLVAAYLEGHASA